MRQEWEERSSKQRKSSHADPIPVHRDSRTFRQGGLTLKADRADEIRLLCGVNAADAKQDHGGAALRGDRKMGMKVMISRDADSLAGAGCLEDGRVFSTVQPDLGDMNRVEALLPK